jgi:hypothetical protein
LQNQTSASIQLKMRLMRKISFASFTIDTTAEKAKVWAAVKARYPIDGKEIEMSVMTTVIHYLVDGHEALRVYPPGTLHSDCLLHSHDIALGKGQPRARFWPLSALSLV